MVDDSFEELECQLPEEEEQGDPDEQYLSPPEEVNNGKRLGAFSSRKEKREAMFWDWVYARCNCAAVGQKYGCSSQNVGLMARKYKWEEKRKIIMLRAKNNHEGMVAKGDVMDRIRILSIMSKAIKKCEEDIDKGNDKAQARARRELPSLVKSWKDLQTENDENLDLSGLSRVELIAFLTAATPKVVDDETSGFCEFRLQELDIPALIREVRQDPTKFCNLLKIQGVEKYNEQEDFEELASQLAKVPRRPKVEGSKKSA